LDFSTSPGALPPLGYLNVLPLMLNLSIFNLVAWFSSTDSGWKRLPIHWCRHIHGMAIWAA
jgi:hypothetical protein